MGVAGLFARLDQASDALRRPALVRGPAALEPGEDLDVLVADDDLDGAQVLRGGAGTMPVDLYSETGLPGSDYRGVAYYPPVLARQLLERAVVHASGARVPGPMEHLHSLGYHAAYHKGSQLGRAHAWSSRSPRPEHDYASVLRRLARGARPAAARDAGGARRALAADGWRPPMDTVRRLSPGNAWLAARFPLARSPDEEPPEPAVFLVRQRALALFDLAEVERLLAHYGFETLLARELDEPSRARCAAQLRGGNWGEGPNPVSGGGPAAVVVAAHYGPAGPVRRSARSTPGCPTWTCWRPSSPCALRSSSAPAARGGSTRCTAPTTSTRRGSTPSAPCPTRSPASATSWRSAGTPTAPTCRCCGSSAGAPGQGRAGREPGRPGRAQDLRRPFSRHLERELRARSSWGRRCLPCRRCSTPAPAGSHSRTYTDELASTWRDGRLVPLTVVRQMVEVLRQVHALGFDVLDAKPQNFLLDPEHGLKLLDYEFLHRYEGPAPAFADS